MPDDEQPARCDHCSVFLVFDGKATDHRECERAKGNVARAISSWEEKIPSDLSPELRKVLALASELGKFYYPTTVPDRFWDLVEGLFLALDQFYGEGTMHSMPGILWERLRSA